MAPPSRQPPPLNGAVSVESVARERLDAVEDRLLSLLAGMHQQVAADRQEADRLAELTKGRFEAQFDAADQQQQRLERRVSDLDAFFRTIDDEQQAQGRRVSLLSDLLQNVQAQRRETDVDIQRRLTDVEQDHRALAAANHLSAARDEETQRHYVYRLRPIEERLCALEDERRRLCDEVEGPLEARLRSLEERGDAAAAVAFRRSEDNRIDVDMIPSINKLEGTLHEELRVIHARCDHMQDVVDNHVVQPMRGLEQELERLSSNDSACGARLESEGLRIGLVHSKVEANERQFANLKERLDRLSEPCEHECNRSFIYFAHGSQSVRPQEPCASAVGKAFVSPSAHLAQGAHNGRVDDNTPSLERTPCANLERLNAFGGVSHAVDSSEVSSNQVEVWDISTPAHRRKPPAQAQELESMELERLASRVAACEHSGYELRTQFGRQATELTSCVQAGLAEAREHLDTVAQQFGQLNERISRQESVVYAEWPTSSSAAALVRVDGLEERVRENALATGSLQASIRVIQASLSSIKTSIDMALTQRLRLDDGSTNAAVPLDVGVSLALSAGNELGAHRTAAEQEAGSTAAVCLACCTTRDDEQPADKRHASSTGLGLGDLLGQVAHISSRLGDLEVEARGTWEDLRREVMGLSTRLQEVSLTSPACLHDSLPVARPPADPDPGGPAGAGGGPAAGSHFAEAGRRLAVGCAEGDGAGELLPAGSVGGELGAAAWRLEAVAVLRAVEHVVARQQRELASLTANLNLQCVEVAVRACGHDEYMEGPMINATEEDVSTGELGSLGVSPIPDSAAKGLSVSVGEGVSTSVGPGEHSNPKCPIGTRLSGDTDWAAASTAECGSSSEREVPWSNGATTPRSSSRGLGLRAATPWSALAHLSAALNGFEAALHGAEYAGGLRNTPLRDGLADDDEFTALEDEFTALEDSVDACVNGGDRPGADGEVGTAPLCRDAFAQCASAPTEGRANEDLCCCAGAAEAEGCRPLSDPLSSGADRADDRLLSPAPGAEQQQQ